MPTFFPGNAQEVLDLGLHAYACSRASGLWSGFKIVTSVADALGTADVAPGRVVPVLPDLGYEHVPNGNLLPPASLELERSLLGVRTDLALAYARENGVNRIEGARDAWLGIVAAGKPYYDLLHALRSLGLDERELERAGIRVLKLGHDLAARAGHDARVRAGGSTRSSWSRRRARSSRPSSRRRSTARRTRRGSSASATSRATSLLPMELDLDADLIARAVAGRLRRRGLELDSVQAHLRRLDEIAAPPRRAADGPAHAVLLLGLPAQLLDQGARGHARGRRDRLPHDGPAQPRGQGRDHRHHADGRRGRAVDRHGAVHRRPPPRPEPRRRHLPPLGLAGRARGGRRGREHHLQAALQRARRDDRRPGDRGPAARSRT